MTSQLGHASIGEICKCPVWTAPLVKGFVEALRTSRARSCLRPVDAEWMAPLALMIGPHGSSPPSPYRAPNRRGHLHGLPSLSDGSHHFVGALDSVRRVRRELSLPSPSRPSGRNRPVVIFAAPGHQHEDDARDLVGERHRGQLELVFGGLALEHRARPQAQGVVMAFAMAERRAGAHHQKLAQVAVAHLGDAPEPRFAAGRVLARRQAEEGGELAPAGEDAGVLDRGHNRRCGDRADAGNGHQPPGGLVGLDRRCDLPVDRSDRLVEGVDLADERTKRDAHAIGDHDLAVVVEAVGGHALQVIGVLRTLRRDDADLAKWPRSALSAAVRWPASNSRARWRISSAWLSIERTGTNRWPGRPAASQIAAASTWSLLLRRT